MNPYTSPKPDYNVPSLKTQVTKGLFVVMLYSEIAYAVAMLFLGSWKMVELLSPLFNGW